MSDTTASDAKETLDNPMDDWAAALAEQTAASAPAIDKHEGTPANLFQPLQPQKSENTASSLDIDMLRDVPVQITVELGRTRMTIRELLQLGQGSVIELDGMAGEPLDILVNGYLIAQGEVVVVGDQYGVRLTDIVTPAERLSRLTAKR